jgi:hypothetical protein
MAGQDAQQVPMGTDSDDEDEDEDDYADMPALVADFLPPPFPPPILQPLSPPPPELNLQLAAMLAHAHQRAVAEEEMMLQAALLEMYSYPTDPD